MSWRTPRRERNDRGFSLISLLIVLIILGVMMALTIDGLNGTGLPTSPTSGSTSGVTTTGGAGGIVTQAAVSACEADYSSIENAIVTYFSDNGKPPGPGTTWATINPYGAPIMQSWPTGAPNFTFAWSGTVLSVDPRYGPASTDSVGTPSPRTGCYAA
jgi:type II secretory pathway pseudopilin PulG